MVNTNGKQTHIQENKNLRAGIYFDFIDSARMRYVNRYRFDGDPKFTISKQILFFESVFDYGSAGIANILKNKDIKEVISSSYGMNGYDEISSNKNALIVLKPLAYWHDLDNNIAKAICITPVNQSSKKFGIPFTNENCAFMKFNSEYTNGWIRWGDFASLYSEAFTILRKKMLLSNAKVFRNNFNSTGKSNSQLNKDIVDVDKTIVNLHPAQKSITENASSNKIDIGTLFPASQEMLKLDFNSNSTIKDINDGIETIKNNAYELWGEKKALEYKKSRHAAGDIDNQEKFSSKLERSMLNQIIIFVEKYEDVFGIKLKIIDLIKEEEDEKEKKDKEREVNENEKNSNSNI